jgi:DNA mismatch endonuclease (patch repair protein)
MALSRSQQMARIRGTNTSPECVLRSALWRAGHRYRLHMKTPVGRPDVVFPAARVAVFIDGCFWHGCPAHYVRPRSRTDFWSAKLAENVARDQAQTLALETLGWRVVRVWEHEALVETDVAVARIAACLGGAGPHADSDWRVVRVDSVDEASSIERRHLVDLRDPSLTRTEEGLRSTAKWKRSAVPPGTIPPPASRNG